MLTKVFRPIWMCTLYLAFAVTHAAAQEAKSQPPEIETWSLHGQITFTEQYHPAYSSPYAGPNSLDPASDGRETFDATLFAGVRLWDGAEAWANPEIDQGFGLSDTLGIVGFPSGEAYKIGKASPYFRLHRLFLRQTFDLGGDTETIAPDANQLGGVRDQDNIVITAGKISAVDIFDTNDYAHDPRGDFMNWTIIDSGAYDYAADSWAYTYGGVIELTQSWWTWRWGLFDLSRFPNEANLVRGFGEYEIVTEAEARETLGGRPGKIKLLLFVNRGRMGSYEDAIALGQATNSVPSTALVRKPAFRGGAALNLQQEINDNLGAFARFSLNDGSKETYEFTDVNASATAGLSLNGNLWGRPQDRIGIAGLVNGISKSARAYFDDGGLGLLIGDGRLTHYGTEDILETYYRAPLTQWLSAGVDYQFIANPAYNRDRGPVSVLSFQLHSQL
jgi:high affinity Mn2+ porin